MTSDAVAVLRSNPHLDTLGPTAAQALVERAQRLEVDTGRVVFMEGEAGSSLYIVLEGRVRLTRRCQGVGALRLAEVGPGGIVGEMALLDPAPRTATAVAIRPVDCLCLSHDDLDDLLYEDAAVARDLVRAIAAILVERVRRTHAQVGELLEAAQQQGVRVDNIEREMWGLLHQGVSP